LVFLWNDDGKAITFQMKNDNEKMNCYFLRRFWCMYLCSYIIVFSIILSSIRGDVQTTSYYIPELHRFHTKMRQSV